MLNDLNTRLDLPSTSANRLDAPTQNLIGWAMDTQKYMAKLVEVVSRDGGELACRGLHMAAIDSIRPS